MPQGFYASEVGRAQRQMLYNAVAILNRSFGIVSIDGLSQQTYSHKMDRAAILPILFNLFRQYGYDGVSLSQISKATGLGKASLYHHFPRGKMEMLQATLTYSQTWFEDQVLSALQADGTAEKRIQQMCEQLSDLYAHGKQPCLLATLTTGISSQACQEHVKLRMQLFIEAIATVLVEQGLPTSTAKQRAEDALISIQGGLILARGLEDPSLFQRTLSKLPSTLCKP